MENTPEQPEQPEQFARVEYCLPTQRGHVSMTNPQVVNAMLYVAEHGCKWHGLPKRFGNWHTIYTRMRSWEKAGGLLAVEDAVVVEFTLRGDERR